MKSYIGADSTRAAISGLHNACRTNEKACGRKGLRACRQRGRGGADGGRRGGAVAGFVTRTSRGNVPKRTVQYRTILCLTLPQEHTAKHILPCLSQRKPGGKKAAVGSRRKCGNLCGNLVARSSGRCGHGHGRGGARGSADRGDVRVRQGLLLGHSAARAFGRCGFGGRFCLARCCGRAVRDAGSAQGALACFLAERKNA